MGRLFSREEAEQVLPKIVPLLEELRSLKRQYDEWQEKAQALQQTMKSNGHGIDVELARVQSGQTQTGVQMRGLIERVAALGAEVKDIDTGLIDFRSRLKGREVYLCWKLGEGRIAYWHDLDTGYAGRQPLD